MANYRFMTDNLVSQAQLSASSETDGLVGLAVKLGQGAAAAVSGGVYTGAGERVFTVQIDSLASGAEVGLATFRWKHSDSTDWEATGAATSTSFTNLADGVKIKWVSGSGDDFVLGDSWRILCTKPFGRPNLSDWDRNTVYRSHNLDGPNWLKTDLGEAKNVKACAILDHNFSSGADITLQASTIDALGAGSALSADQEAWVVASSEEDETGATGYYVSTVDGSAFFQAIGLDLSNFVGKFLRAKDSAGKVAYGYIQSAGDGETLGAEKNTVANAASDPNGNETNAVGNWGGNYDTVESQGVVKDTGSFAMHQVRSSTGSYSMYAGITVVQGQLYKITVAVKVVSGAPTIGVGEGDGAWGDDLEAGITGDWTNKTYYYVQPVSGPNFSFGWHWASNFEGYLDNLSIRQVTDCAATGIRIVSAAGGATQNWTYIESGFDPDDDSMIFDICEADPWSSPAYSQALTWATGKIVYFLDQTYQWWRLEVSDQNNPDEVLTLSQFYLGGYEAPELVIRRDLTRRLDASDPLLYATEGLCFQFLCPSQTVLEELVAIFKGQLEQSNRRMRPFFFCLDASQASDWTWLVQFEATLNQSLAGPESFLVDMNLKELERKYV